MVVVVGGVPLEEPLPDSTTLIHLHPGFRETASHFIAIPSKIVGPVGLLYVQQREMAVTVPHDKNVSIIGTDDVTTCTVVVLRHTGSGAVCLAHLDCSVAEEAVANMVSRVQELAMGYQDGRIQLHFIGGYSDQHNFTEELFYNLLHFFHKQPVEFDLVSLTLGELNTTVRNGIHWPIIYGVGVDVKTGDIFPATFPDKGPESALRTARYLTGGHTGPQLLDVYDCGLGLLRIGPFNYHPMRCVDLWLAQTDEFILQHLSTSPEVEPPHFVMNMRATLKYIQEHPFPAVTVFRDNRPHYYRRDEISGTWTPFRY
ncbi:unnamed protein product [Nesidiocoris tenuis]|uniref:Protein N-terminal asparagine amidohydrolase n=1 Tax=Nesidiocoris tenuis TaxID=355587 RepID=A0A6H5GDS9_9HEMI|nr:unnamed protein product [Nesidiocoris tenuis]CAB0001496.1 unnamed protein product [Nesidiocoris tenuis]